MNNGDNFISNTRRTLDELFVTSFSSDEIIIIQSAIKRLNPSIFSFVAEQTSAVTKVAGKVLKDETTSVIEPSIWYEPHWYKGGSFTWKKTQQECL
jgi:hypothetical protein